MLALLNKFRKLYIITRMHKPSERQEIWDKNAYLIKLIDLNEMNNLK